MLSAREEIVIELFRQLHTDQRNEFVKKLRAAVDANSEIERRMGRPLKPVSNERVAAKFGTTPPPQKRRSNRGKDE